MLKKKENTYLIINIILECDIMRKKIKIEDWKLEIGTKVLTSRYLCQFESPLLCKPQMCTQKVIPQTSFSFRKMEKQHTFVSA